MPKFYMDDAEIAREYRTAKNKRNQITVLAELNAVSVDEMREKLLELGLANGTPGKSRRTTIDDSLVPVAARKPQIDHARARELYDQGKGDTAIARELGCSVAGVRSWRERSNLPPVVRVGAPKGNRNGAKKNAAALENPGEGVPLTLSTLAQYLGRFVLADFGDARVKLDGSFVRRVAETRVYAEGGEAVVEFVMEKGEGNG